LGQIKEGCGLKRFILIVIAAAVGGIMLAWAAAGGQWIKTISVDEFLAGQAQLGERSLQIYGAVLPGTIEQAGGEMRFSLAGKAGRDLRVVYRGSRVDIKDGIEVLVYGRSGSGGTLNASRVLTKCPSKYEKRKES
jgi:cytochrome c-type biogenesis protein CcmE